MFGGSPTFEEPVAMTSEDAQAWYAQVSADTNPLHWAIELDGRFIGTTRLHSLNETDRRARYAIGLLDRNSWVSGLAAWSCSTGSRWSACVARQDSWQGC